MGEEASFRKGDPAWGQRGGDRSALVDFRVEWRVRDRCPGKFDGRVIGERPLRTVLLQYQDSQLRCCAEDATLEERKVVIWPSADRVEDEPGERAARVRDPEVGWWPSPGALCKEEPMRI